MAHYCPVPLTTPNVVEIYDEAIDNGTQQSAEMLKKTQELLIAAGVDHEEVKQQGAAIDDFLNQRIDYAAMRERCG